MSFESKKTIRYVCCYDTADNAIQNRYYNLAAATKIEYICDVINKCGYNVEIISASYTNSDYNFYRGSTRKISNDRFLKLFFTFPRGNCVLKVISTISMRLLLFLELLRIHKNETVIVYHALGFMLSVYFAHLIKGFKLVYEVEELYSDVIRNKRIKGIEKRLLGIGDSYIFSTELLSPIVNTRQKPYLVIHGTYKVEMFQRIEKDTLSFEADRIHCVYAGNLEPRKGAATAIAATDYLPPNYWVHIIGFGTKKDIESINRMVLEKSNCSKALVSYDGCFTGDDYIRFIQQCDIGLCTQDLDAEYNETSFPSKILSFLANGLKVVSVRIPAITTSKLSDILYYCNDTSPEAIAETICRIEVNDSSYDSKRVIRLLSEEFVAGFKTMIEKLYEGG